MIKTQEFPLTLNYRSDIAICEAANRLIKHNLNRIDKPIVPVSTKQGNVSLRRFNHEGEEIYGVWGAICDLMQHPEAWSFETGCNYDEIAVLARTNSLVEKYRETLRGLGLPIKRLGGVRLPADWSFALTCISLMIDPGNDFHAEELLKARGDSPESIQKWKIEAARGGHPLATGLIRLPEIQLSDLAQTLLLLGVTGESCQLIQQRIKVLPNADATLSDLLADLWRNDTWNVEDPGVGVTVCTIHAAKGKEWDVVFVVAMEEGILPHGKHGSGGESSSEDVRPSDSASSGVIGIGTRSAGERTSPVGSVTNSSPAAMSLEEERRLAFVAITRARHLLFLSHSTRRTMFYKEYEQQPSRFLAEMIE